MGIRTVPLSDLAWCAGLFEGEGCFTFRSKRGNPSAVIKMTDRDVLDRFATVIGFGRISSVRSTSSLGKKQQWEWRVNSFMHVQALIAALWPWLCSRRKARAQEVLSVSRALPSAGSMLAKRNGVCAKGHEMNEGTTYMNPNSGRRFCKVCRDSYMKTYYRNNKEKWVNYGASHIR